MKVKCEVVEKWHGHYPGATFETDPETALRLKNEGHVVFCGEEKPKRRRKKKELTEDANSEGPPEDEPKVMTYKKWTKPDAE